MAQLCFYAGDTKQARSERNLSIPREVLGISCCSLVPAVRTFPGSYGCSYDHNDIYQVIYQDYALSFMYSANLCIKIKLFLIHLNSVHRWEEHKKQQEMKSTSGRHHVYLKPSVLTVFIALSPFAKGNTTGWRFRWDGQSARSLSWTSELTLGDSCSQPLTCFTLSSRINNTAVCAVFAGSSLSQLCCFVS